MLIGQKGIGKATLAYRLARFVLANPDPAAPQSTRQRRSQSILIIRWPAGWRRRRTAIFSSSSARLNEKVFCASRSRSTTFGARCRFSARRQGEGGWRVAIVDARRLNPFGANALLKVLEEPPQRALLLLVCHSASRSCRHCVRVVASLRCGPCWRATWRAAASAATGRPADRSAGQRRRLPQPTAASRAPWLFLDADALGAASARARRARSVAGAQCQCAACARRRARRYRSAPAQRFCRYRQWLAVAVARSQSNDTGALARLERLAEAWERINAAARDAETTIWSENPWYSACSACLPRPRAVDTYAPSLAGQKGKP